MVSPLIEKGNEERGFLVFDTGPLSHAAKSQLLGVLKVLSANKVAIMTDVVELELRNGLHLVREISSVLEADWIERRRLTTPDELNYYQTFSKQLVGMNGRNRGEASVLAWASAHPGSEVVVDDSEARKLADDAGIPRRGTLRFLIDAINDGHLGRAIASDLADEILASGSRSPFKAGGFLNWAERQNLLL